MMKKSLPFLMLLVLFGCAKNDPVVPPTPPTPPQPVKPLITLPAGWKLNSSFSATFPTDIQVYTFDSVFSGRKTRAYCFAYQSANATVEFKPALASAAKTPSQFVLDEPGLVYACINGGYFGTNQSFSLIKYNDNVLAPNVKALSRPLGSGTATYYPTRAAFGITDTRTPDVKWVYSIGSGNSDVYAYPSPSPNLLGSAPQQVPDAGFPVGGASWKVTSAIGGSPVLVYNNQVNITDKEELIDINNSSPRPRSAIGYTGSGVVLIVAIQGDGFIAGYDGMSLPELAALMKDLGCSHAMNLDGGGSTTMIIGGMQTVKPSASGVERPVVSVLMIRKK
jgi:hypothetical protein